VALRTSRFILKGTPLIISWFTSSLICVFRHWNDVKLSYDSQTYSAEPLGTLDLNLEHQLPEDNVLYGPHYHNTLHLPSTPTLQYFPQALDSRYEEEDGSNPPLGDSDWNGIVDGFQRGIYDAPHPFIPPTNQYIEESTATVSVPLVNTTSEVPGQDIFVGFKEEDEETPLSMLWDGGRSLDDFPQELLSSEYEDHPSPPTQEALVSSAPQQPGISGGNDLGIAFAHPGTADMGIMSMGSQEDQGYFQDHEAFPAHTLPQPVLPFVVYRRLEQSDDNITAPIASSSSSSHGGVVRTRRTALHHHTVYTRPDSFPPTVPESHNPSYPRWSCQWDGCNAIFSSFKELKDHVLRPEKDDEHTVSVHRLPRGHSKEMRCRWGDCSANLNGIWRHILSDVHVFIRYHCPTCSGSKSRQPRPLPGHCC
jgi:hypothetical protein